MKKYGTNVRNYYYHSCKMGPECSWPWVGDPLMEPVLREKEY